MPEGMWLPETAVNMEVVNILVEERIKFIILSPYQAKRIRSLNGGEWIDVRGGRIDPKMAYRIFLKSSKGRIDRKKYLDVFFYDASTAKAIAFENLLISSKLFLERIKNCFLPDRDYQLFNVATDGESYGHHRKFGELCLAYLVSHELPKHNIKLVNYGYFLEMHPPCFEVELEEGEDKKGSSWSCFHGVERWNSDCGCTTGSRPGWNQKWRRPLRKALDILRDELGKLYEDLGSIYLKDVWEARDDYIGVILNRNRKTISKFFERHLKEEITKREKIKVLKLLEIQRNALLMYTSCGWFFADISGIETVQNLKYALRAIQLAKELGKMDLEERFLGMLKQAKSNLKEYRNGLGVYRKLVAPSMANFEKIAAQYSMLLLFHPKLEKNFYHYHIEIKDLVKKDLDVSSILTGWLKITDGIIFETKEFLFFVLYLPEHIIQAYVKESDKEDNFRILRKKVEEARKEEVLDGFKRIHLPLFGRKYYTLSDLFIDQREEVFSILIKNKMEKIKALNESILEEYLPIAKEAEKLDIPIPSEIKIELEKALNYKLIHLLDDLINDFKKDLFNLLIDLTKQGEKLNLRLDYEQLKNRLRELMKRLILKLKNEFNKENIELAIELANFGRDLGGIDWDYQSEAIIFDFLRKLNLSENKSNHKEIFLELANLFGFSIEKR
jgi:hypothetical protein